MGCGEVCESEFVTGYLHNGKSAQDLFVCDHKWIFLKVPLRVSENFMWFY